LACSIYAYFNFFKANIDKRFRRSLLQWADLLKFVEDHGYHAAESKKYGLAPLCKHCSDKKKMKYLLKCQEMTIALVYGDALNVAAMK